MNYPEETKALKRRVRELEKTLREHTDIARKVIAAIDAEMKRPADNARGQRIGRIIHALEWSNDSARHFQLGEEFPLSRP